MNDLRPKDIKYLWHPYTDIDKFEKQNFPIFKKGQECYLYDTDNREYIDAISSWWCVNFGHSHPKLINAIKEQADKLQHAIIGGQSHLPIIELAEKLIKISPDKLQHAYFASDGSSATEAALRIAVQYWHNIGKSNKTKFLTLDNGYHGDTMGAVGVGYIDLFHKEIANIIPKNLTAKASFETDFSKKEEVETYYKECFENMEKIIIEQHNELAGVILEPLCQGAAGVRIYDKKYISKIRKLCNENNVLFIADEIAVGLGRTGSMFACDLAGISPDIMTIGKALTGGYLPMSATLTTDEIYNSFKKGKTFYHGHTFAGNPIAANAANALLSLYENEDIFKDIKIRGEVMKKRLQGIQKHSNKIFTQSLGMISSIHIGEEIGGSNIAKNIAKECIDKGILIRPLSNTIYIWPPIIMEISMINYIFDIIEKALKKQI